MHRSATFPGDPAMAGLLAEYGEVLEREVALRREVEALRGELERARVVADDARHVKSAFVAHMSHELRTPINAIVGLLEQMLTGPLTDEQRELAGLVRASGEHLAHTIGGILELTQLEQSALALVHRPFALVEEIEVALAAVAPFAAALGVELCLTASDEAYVTAVGDAGRLRQVLVNIVGNAVRFGGAGDVEVHVEVERVGDEVVAAVEVRDHGPGVAPAVLSRLFSETDSGSVGFGLPICARVCALMGGKIALENHAEGGAVARFSVRLGFAGPAAAREVASLAGRRVQVETASAGLRAVLVGWLARWGAQVVDEGGELVIADEGRPACSAMGVPVVVLVAVGSQMRPGSAAACVTRPVVHDRLVAAVRLACAAKPSRSPASPVAAADASRLRILVAEDNPFNQRVILGALRRLGYAADVVTDGRAAVEAVASKPYDLVLMDVMMPELDGVAATREICARWSSDERPRIVAITAQATGDDQAACMAAGMADFLTKPLDTSRLAAVLQGCPRRGE